MLDNPVYLSNILGRLVAGLCTGWIVFVFYINDESVKMCPEMSVSPADRGPLPVFHICDRGHQSRSNNHDSPRRCENNLITLRPRQNGRHFADDILKCISLNENVWIPIEISLKFIPTGPIDTIPALVQIMAWRRAGDKPLSEPMMVILPTHICVARPQWVNCPVLHCLLSRSMGVFAFIDRPRKDQCQCPSRYTLQVSLRSPFNEMLESLC